MKHLLIILTALFNVCTAFASGIAVPRTNGMFLDIVRTTVDTKIRDQVAVTTTTQTFVHDQPPERVEYGINVPEDATVTSLRWLLRGSWHSAEIVRSDIDGVTEGRDTISRGRSVLTSTLGTSLHYRAVALFFEFKDTLRTGDTLVVEITTVQMLEHSHGVTTYTYPLSRDPIRRLMRVNLWTIDIRSSSRLLEYRNDMGATPMMSDTSVMDVVHDIILPMQLHFEYSLAIDSVAMNVLCVKPPNEDGYTLMLAAPRALNDSRDNRPIRVSFVLDRTSSMSSTKIMQAAEAIKYSIAHLRTNELFRIIPFMNDVLSHWPVHVYATSPNVTRAMLYLDSWYTSSEMSMTKALTTALSLHKNDEYENVIVLLTDGLSDVDYSALQQANNSQTRIFVLGIGYDVNTEMLTRIADEHHGAAVFVRTESETALSARLLYEHLRVLVIRNPTVNVEHRVLKDVYPTRIPSVCVGEQLRFIGRYATPGHHVVMINGLSSAGPTHHRFTVHFTTDSLVNNFLPILWARERVKYLIDLMSKEPDSSEVWKEWRDEVIRVGLTYALVTPYTTLTDTRTKDDLSPTSVSIRGETPRSTVAIAPNPTSERTQIRIPREMDGATDQTVFLTDAAGHQIRTLLSAGEAHAPELEWDLRDDTGAPVPSGVYRVVISSAAGSTSTSVVVVR